VSEEPLHCCAASETRRLVQSLLGRLPSRYAEVLQLKYIDDRSVAEIGETMGIGYSAAESILARARTAFRGAAERLFGARKEQRGDDLFRSSP
jgi:RNA polymerase sigma-70 factor (ECF subfamily)